MNLVIYVVYKRASMPVDSLDNYSENGCDAVEVGVKRVILL